MIQEIENIGHILETRFGKERVEKMKRGFAPRRLTVIMVEDKIAVLRPITAAELSQYSLIVADTEAGGIDKAARYLLDTLWIDGDTEIRDDEEYFMAAMLQVQNAIEVKKSACCRI